MGTFGTILTRLYRSYTTRLLLLFLLVFMPPLYYLGANSVRSIEDSARQTALAEFRLQVRSVASAIENMLDASRQVADGVATTVYPMMKTPWETETVLVGFRHASPLIRRLAVVEPDGREWASSDAGREKQDWSRRSLWPAIRSCKEQHFLMRVGQGEPPEVLLVTPIPAPGPRRRLLVCDLNLIGIWCMVDGLRFGDTGRAELYAQGRFALASEDRNSVVAGRTPGASARALLKASDDRSQESEREFLAAARLKAMHLTVLLRKDAVEVFAGASRVRRTWQWVMVFSAAVVLLAAVLLPQFLVRPLRVLSDRARAIAKGELDMDPLPRRRDELDALFMDFNHMLSRLRLARSLEQRAAIGDAVERITHDLGTPLTALKTFVGLLEKRPDDAKLLQEFLGLVPAEIARLERLLDAMREYSREAALHLEPVELRRLVEEIMLVHQPLAETLGIEIRLAEGSPACPLRVDVDQIKRVITNLLSNGLDALGRGHAITLTLAPHAEADGMSGICLRIKDDGPGVPEEIAARLFRPFVSKREGGLGLGLAICRSIVNAHGGHIRYEPNAPHGACFVIWLPCAEDENHAA